MSENEQNEFEQTQATQDVDLENTTTSQNENEQQSSAANKKNPPNIVPVLMIAGFFSLFGLMIAATALLITGHKIGGIVCAVLFATILLSAVFGSIISSEWSMRNDIRKAKKILDCKVIRCVMSNMTEYSVDVIVDGNTYTMTSKESYETDDTVKVAIFNKKRARIVDEKELELLNEPLYSKAPSRHYHRHHHHH